MDNGKKTYVTIVLALAGLALKKQAFGQNQFIDPFKNVGIIAEKLQPLPLSAIKPNGWLKQQLSENLNGFTGKLDQLAPDLIVNDDIYGANRISKNVKSKKLGALTDAGDVQAQFLWWNSETQSNWWDGYIRTAILLNSKNDFSKIQGYVNKILATQDADGYLGIYDKDLRFKFDNENGELWSKTTLLRGLLAWYSYTQNKKLLIAIKRATANVFKNYPINLSHPFYSVNPNAGGLTHGLVFTDVLEELYRITKDKQYMDYCFFLYRDFSEQVLNEDAQYRKLIDANLALQGHGVHTYEHLRALAAAFYASGNPELKNALANFLAKIARTTTPSGGPAGDEFIGGRAADATTTGYEYCSLQELMDGYISLLTKTGAADYGNKAEHIFFNAAQGSRHPTESAICYLKTDNSYALNGGKNGDTTDKTQTRYRYSPLHREAAVCCVPNAGRIGPNYIQHMWMKDKNALVAVLLGPCELNTILNGKKISVKEVTQYPFEGQISFKVKIAAPQTFDLKIRKPDWATNIKSNQRYKIEDGFIVIYKTWAALTEVNIQFDTKPVEMKSADNEVYFTCGPLVLAHNLDGIEKITRVFPGSNLKEMNYTAPNPVIYAFTGHALTSDVKKEGAGTVRFKTVMFNTQTGLNEVVELQPMGGTILRQVTFKDMSLK